MGERTSLKTGHPKGLQLCEEINSREDQEPTPPAAGLGAGQQKQAHHLVLLRA